MTTHNKLRTLDTILSTGMIPVFHHPDAELTQQIAVACYNGGVRAFEFTNRGDFAHETFAALAKYIPTHCPGMTLGAGSIIDAPTAVMYMQLGADFIVGPLFNPEVAKVCNRRSVPYIPGCGSATEIGYAQEAGCDICKIFPAGSVGGPGFVKAVKAPMPWTKIMATGAVEPTEESLSSWIKAGTDCVGIGSKLFPDKAVAAEEWTEISRICQSALFIIKKYRTS